MWTSLGRLIPRYLKQHALNKKLQEQEVYASWGHVMEEMYRGASRFASATAIKDDALYVAVHNQLWISELEGNKYTLLHSLRRTCPTLERIVFQYRPVKNRQP